MRLPRNRPPTHPGEILLEEFLVPLDMSQTQLAEALGISFVRVNAIVNGRRGVTPDTALRLERLFGSSAQFWLNLQMAWDLWHAMHAPGARRSRRSAEHPDWRRPAHSPRHAVPAHAGTLVMQGPESAIVGSENQDTSSSCVGF